MDSEQAVSDARIKGLQGAQELYQAPGIHKVLVAVLTLNRASCMGPSHNERGVLVSACLIPDELFLMQA